MHRPAAATIVLLLPIANNAISFVLTGNDDRLSTREPLSSGHSPDWLKSKNLAAPAAKREAEEGLGPRGGDDVQAAP
jgi:hypothetical protein